MSLPTNYQDFRNKLSTNKPPALWPETLQALWWDAKGDWEQSHTVAQDIPSATGSWIHAYLHRKEGDRWNAAYWYDRAKRPFPEHSLDQELEELVSWVLSNP